MWTKSPEPTSFGSSFPAIEPNFASGGISTLVVDPFFTSIGPVEPNPSPGTITRNCLTEANQRIRNRPFASSFPVNRASAGPWRVSPSSQTGITCTGRSASGLPSEPRTKTSTSPGSVNSTPEAIPLPGCFDGLRQGRVHRVPEPFGPLVEPSLLERLDGPAASSFGLSPAFVDLLGTLAQTIGGRDESAESTLIVGRNRIRWVDLIEDVKLDPCRRPVGAGDPGHAVDTAGRVLGGEDRTHQQESDRGEHRRPPVGPVFSTYSPAVPEERTRRIDESILMRS